MQLKAGRLAFRWSGFWLVMITAFITRTMVHESVHQIVMEGLGGTGKIIFETILTYIPLGGRVTFVEGYPLPEPLWPIYIAGGIGAAIFPWFALWLFSWITTEEGDTWVEGISASVVLTEALYAPTELILLNFGKDAHAPFVTAAFFAAQVIFFALYTRPLVRWWLGKHLGTQKRKQATIQGMEENRQRKELKKLEKKSGKK